MEEAIGLVFWIPSGAASFWKGYPAGYKPDTYGDPVPEGREGERRVTDIWVEPNSGGVDFQIEFSTGRRGYSTYFGPYTIHWKVENV